MLTGEFDETIVDTVLWLKFLGCFFLTFVYILYHQRFHFLQTLEAACLGIDRQAK